MPSINPASRATPPDTRGTPSGPPTARAVEDGRPGRPGGATCCGHWRSAAAAACRGPVPHRQVITRTKLINLDTILASTGHDHRRPGEAVHGCRTQIVTRSATPPRWRPAGEQLLETEDAMTLLHRVSSTAITCRACGTANLMGLNVVEEVDPVASPKTVRWDVLKRAFGARWKGPRLPRPTNEHLARRTTMRHLAGPARLFVLLAVLRARPGRRPGRPARFTQPPSAGSSVGHGQHRRHRDCPGLLNLVGEVGAGTARW